MKRFFLRVLPIALLGGLVLGSASVNASVFTIPGNHLLADPEFGSAAWGPGTVSRVAGPGTSVDFTFAGLDTPGTGVEDNYPVAAVYGQLGGAFNANFSNFTGYALQVKNLDDAPVSMQIFINTGFTVPNPFDDTYWELPAWKTLGAGETAILVLDFDNARGLHLADNVPPHTTGAEGSVVTINGLDRTEVTNIGFRVADFSLTNPNATVRISPPDNITVDPSTVRCLNIANPCDTVGVVFTRVDPTPVRGFSVTFQLSSELELCGGLTASIREGSYLRSDSSRTHYEVSDNGGGSYTVDCAILGMPCGAVGSGTLFTIDVKGSGGDATGTIAVTSVTARDCDNAPVPAIPGMPASITVDYTRPVAIADLAAAQVKSGNGSSGMTKIGLTFTAPGDASVIEVYRAPFGNYPEYNDVFGSGVPGTPGYPPPSPWALTSVSASGDKDQPPSRDFWYYVVFTKDACGNVSGVSNQTAGTLDYHLGDVTPPAGTGDNLVNSVDISLLGTNYWKNLIAGDPVNYLDVGPTSDYSVNGLPQTDNKINFEDLMMFSINFMQVSLVASPGPSAMEHPRLVLRVDPAGREASDVLTARLILESNDASVKGIHTSVEFDSRGLEFLDATRGALLDGQAAPVFFENLGETNRVTVDLAALGTGQPLRGSGEVAVLRFGMTENGATRPVLKTLDLRDRTNRSLTSRVEATQIGDGLASLDSKALGVLHLDTRPNPMSGNAEVAFAVPQSGDVSLKIYDVKGRLVRTLVEGQVAAGEHSSLWNCRDNSGQEVAPGIYIAILKAGDTSIKQKMSVVP